MAKNVKINGITYNEVTEIKIPLAENPDTMAIFPDTTDADAAAGNLLAGKSAYVNSKKVTGTMPDNGAVDGSIATADGVYSVPAGFHSGTGTVKIAQAEKEKLIAGNIRSGVTVLGVEGSSNVNDTTLSATAATAADVMKGRQAWVNGSLVTGTATTPVISLTDGVLSIA